MLGGEGSRGLQKASFKINLAQAKRHTNVSLSNSAALTTLNTGKQEKNERTSHSGPEHLQSRVGWWRRRAGMNVTVVKIIKGDARRAA